MCGFEEYARDVEGVIDVGRASKVWINRMTTHTVIIEIGGSFALYFVGGEANQTAASKIATGS